MRRCFSRAAYAMPLLPPLPRLFFADVAVSAAAAIFHYRWRVAYAMLTLIPCRR